ncbi:hypothetical protein AB0O76_17060 [Streptomyces sp. NPDC086554]|uniref:hypothetical protein n=1 Tax=Streptomyces sp. NPDC086554 TaxID=3154864 RepID=UPI0034236929
MEHFDVAVIGGGQSGLAAASPFSPARLSALPGAWSSAGTVTATRTADGRTVGAAGIVAATGAFADPLRRVLSSARDFTGGRPSGAAADVHGLGPHPLIRRVST